MVSSLFAAFWSGGNLVIEHVRGDQTADGMSPRTHLRLLAGLILLQPQESGPHAESTDLRGG